MRAFPNRYLIPLALAAAGISAGCPDSWQRLDKPATDAIWVASGEAIPEREEVAALTRRGELFLQYGRLEWVGEEPRVEEVVRPELPPRTPVTLVVGGEWHTPSSDPEEIGRALGEELLGLLLQGENQGWVTRGVHLEVGPEGSLEGFAAVLRGIQKVLPGEVFLSTSVPRPWLRQEGLQEVADAVDFLVPWLYGQFPGEPFWETAWSIAEIVEEARQVDALGQDFLLGVQLLGRVILDPEAGSEGVRTEGSLAELALSPALELVPGFSLSGIDGRRYTFRVKSPLRFAGEPLEVGREVEVVGLGLMNLTDLRRALDRAGLRHYRGCLFHRLPAPEERFLLRREQLEAALGGGSVPREIAVELLPGRGRRGAQDFQVQLTNRGMEGSEIAFIDHNFVEVEADGGYFLSAEQGDFHRYQLLSRDAGGEVRATLRRPDVVRFFRPMLEVGDVVTSGTIRWVPQGANPTLRLRSQFLLPDGESLTSPEGSWQPDP